MDTNRIIERLTEVSQKTIVVIGDFCLDKYVYSNPEEDDVSVETGEAAWQIYSQKTKAGVAGTITNNLLSLGAKVVCVGIAGDDGEGFDMKKRLVEAGADVSYMVTTDELSTATYFKTMRKVEGGYREGVRLDFRNANPPSEKIAKVLLENFKAAIENADGVVISDQFYERNTGTISDFVRDGINEIAKESKLPFLVDSRAFAPEFKHTYIKCNNYELMKYCGVNGDPEKREDVIEGAKKLRLSTGCPVFITRNKDGVVVCGEEIEEVPAYPVHGEIDVTGAGDASNAGMIIGLAIGLTPAEAAKIACAVSSITIHILGDTGTATIEQVIEKLKEH